MCGRREVEPYLSRAYAALKSADWKYGSTSTVPQFAPGLFFRQSLQFYEAANVPKCASVRHDRRASPAKSATRVMRHPVIIAQFVRFQLGN